MAPPPSKKPIEKPDEKDVETSYYNLTGIRSSNSSAEWLVNDSKNRTAIVAHSMADIFLEAGDTMQMLSASHMHSISSKNTQFYKTVDRQVKGNQDVLIGDDNQIHINGSQTVDVVGSHSINIGKKQTVIVGGGQKVEVASGNRTLDVLSGGFELDVAGKLNEEIKGNFFPTYIGKKGHLFNANLTEQDQGDFFGSKISSELSITASLKSALAASGEATAITSAGIKLENTNATAKTFSLKHEIFFGGEYEICPANYIEKNTGKKIVSTKSRVKRILMLSKQLKILKKKNKERENAKLKLEG